MVAGCNQPATERVSDGSEADLTGSWQLERLHGEALTPPDRKDMAATLTLSPGGEASGDGGCNRFSVSYEHRNGHLSFGTITATKMACSDVMEIERGFFEALNETRRYRFQDDRLELLDGEGATLAVLRAIEPPGPSSGKP
jgi:heat shock protein HslJ